MKFKLVVPTNDKINLFENFEASEYFKVITVVSGKITEETFVKNDFKKNNKSEFVTNFCDNITDCNYILSGGCNDEIKLYMKERKKIIIPTSEKIMSNAVYGFIEEISRKDSDTCCCP